ncbi:hypothetical protein QA640_14125 [Bradyrhizobium sp. CB82]|uniref:hypothetical protein n=1 Tax=Bradyrhizobium sp. CB82 TaxID=3039159 RepID=UPI0024B04040|nr:hypothetical protein [Bradyrhizobium sp. CB82]WFU43481.1 hypothetical protein QA640_14125 [Bradyrhizobium sp. CB82]
MNEQFIKGRVLRIREIATNADPFTKRRLLDLANSYERSLRRASYPTAKLPGEQVREPVEP